MGRGDKDIFRVLSLEFFKGTVNGEEPLLDFFLLFEEVSIITCNQ